MVDIVGAIRDLSIAAIRENLIINVVESVPAIPETARMRLGLVHRPMYAHGVRKAIELAAGLGHRATTALELGVGAGGGLRALSRHARYHEDHSELRVRVVGFDLGSGLPASSDPRDLPYAWRPGDYQMDIDGLRQALPPTTELVIGDITKTIPDYLDRHAAELYEAPIGFVSFDLDYYTSTSTALAALNNAKDGHLLPRVSAYFDDIMTIAEHTGELAAIADFNRESATAHVSPVHLLRDYLPFRPTWADRMYEYHRTAHPDYSTYEPARAAPRWLP